jgi:hypothetical protein
MLSSAAGKTTSFRQGRELASSVRADDVPGACSNGASTRPADLARLVRESSLNHERDAVCDARCVMPRDACDACDACDGRARVRFLCETRFSFLTNQSEQFIYPPRAAHSRAAPFRVSVMSLRTRRSTHASHLPLAAWLACALPSALDCGVGGDRNSQFSGGYTVILPKAQEGNT